MQRVQLQHHPYLEVVHVVRQHEFTECVAGAAVASAAVEGRAEEKAESSSSVRPSSSSSSFDKHLVSSSSLQKSLNSLAHFSVEEILRGSSS